GAPPDRANASRMVRSRVGAAAGAGNGEVRRVPGHARQSGPRSVARGGRSPPGRIIVGPTNEKPPPADESAGGGFPTAEDGGFEPPRALTQHAFQACAIGR